MYEDLALYAKAMQGEVQLREFLSKWLKFPEDVIFVIDEISLGDPLATGVTWHLEVAGKQVHLVWIEKKLIIF